MKSALIPETGCEALSATELKKRFAINSTIQNTYPLFEAEPEKLIEIAYMTQSAKRILITLSTGTFNGTLEGLKLSIQKNMDQETLKIIQGKTFKTECERNGEHEFSSVHVEQATGLIIEEIMPETIVDLKNPEIKLYLNINQNNYLLGIDIIGKDLSKRQYRLFNHPNNIKGTIAFNLLIFSEYEPGMTLIDPFSLSGDIPIEASLYLSNISPRYYEKKMDAEKMSLFKNINNIIEKLDKKIKKQEPTPKIHSFDPSFKNISAQKKNAKIAGIEKCISYSRSDLKDVDLKFEKNTVDIVVGRIIEPSKHITENKATKIQEEFLNNIKHIIKKKGTINLVVREPQKIIETANKQGFKTIKKLNIKQGKQELTFIKLIKI